MWRLEKQRAPYEAAAPLRACHTRYGVAGMSMWRMPALRWSASTTALIAADGAPIAPASPAPLMPSGLGLHGTLRVENEDDGRAAARGMRERENEPVSSCPLSSS